MEEGNELKNECLAIFEAGIKAVDGYYAVKKFLKVKGDELHLPYQSFLLSNFQNIYVIGAGKASAYMALAIEELFGDKLNGGLVIVKYGHRVDLKKIKVVEAGHPIPDENGLKATQNLVTLASGFKKDDLIFCVLSGGSSALLPLPVEGISLQEKQETTKLLLECGAPIYEINKIRKHLSQIKGGGLAKIVYPATLISLIISDVVGDKIEIIGSGPTVADSSTFLECQKIIEQYHLTEKVPPRVRKYISAGVKGIVPETPKPGEDFFQKTFNFIIGNNSQCLEAAKEKAKELGYHTLILSSFVEGEAREVAKIKAAILKEIITFGRPIPCPACVISGGETTVTLRSSGKGGRNQEFALALAIEIARWKGAAALSAGTDGTDGPTEAAGAYVDWRTIDRAKKLNLNPHHYLNQNDSFNFFKPLDDLIITGPTKTNVMDLIILIAKSDKP